MNVLPHVQSPPLTNGEGKKRQNDAVNLLSENNPPQRMGFWRAELKRKILHCSFETFVFWITFGKRASTIIHNETTLQQAFSYLRHSDDNISPNFSTMKISSEI